MTDRKTTRRTRRPGREPAPVRCAAARRDAPRRAGDADGRRHAGRAGRRPGDAGRHRAWRRRAQTPRKGGRITVATNTSGVNDTLDPAKQSNPTDYCRGFMFYNGLTALDGSLTPQPSLAEEFTTQDAKTWVFKLRKGVTFHDGKPLTPADVVFSMMRHKDPATASRAKVLADQIEAVTASGPNEVTFRLDLAQRRPAGDPRHLPLPHRQGRHDRLQRRHRHRPLQAQGVQARRALHRRAQRQLLEARPPVPRRDRARRHHRRIGARQRAAVRPARPGPGGLPALGRPRHRRRQVRSLRDQVRLLHQPDHAARQQPGQQPGLRAGHEVPVQPRAAAQVDPARPRGGGQRPAHRHRPTASSPRACRSVRTTPRRPSGTCKRPTWAAPPSRWWSRLPRATRWRWRW